MRTKIPSVPFIYGFALSLLVLFGSNLFVYGRTRSIVWNNPPNYSAECGFPFPFYVYSNGGYLGLDGFYWGGLSTDVVFAIVFSALIGWLYDKMADKRTKISTVR